MLSVYIHVMRGEYDECLQWPFQGKVTIEIFDRDSECWSYEKIFSFHNQLDEVNGKPVEVFENVGCMDTRYLRYGMCFIG